MSQDDNSHRLDLGTIIAAEPSVPGTKEPVFVAEGELRDRTGAAKKGCFLCGTDGSNPSPSSGESSANPAFGEVRRR